LHVARARIARIRPVLADPQHSRLQEDGVALTHADDVEVRRRRSSPIVGILRQSRVLTEGLDHAEQTRRRPAETTEALIVSGAELELTLATAAAIARRGPHPRLVRRAAQRIPQSADLVQLR